MAMSSSATQAVEPSKPDTSTSTAPRKRRRRAPATGASEDCFACRKRQIKCDRRRPYCGQCIEMGKECSGYRTTLTWGVGVASRGKLRGMSLPVAKSPKQNTNTVPESKVQANSNSSASSNAHQNATKNNSQHGVAMGVQSPTSPNMYSAPQEYFHLDATSPIPIPSPNTPHYGFQFPGYGEHMDRYHLVPAKYGRPQIPRGPLQRLHTSVAASYEDAGLSASTGSLSAYSDSDYPSPSDYPQTPDDVPFPDSSVPPYHGLMLNEQTAMSSTESLAFYEAPRSFPAADDMSSSISSDQSTQSTQDYIEVNSTSQGPFGPSSYPDVFLEGDMSASVNGLSHPGYAYLPMEDSIPRFAPFPADAIPAGLLRQIYMPGSRGF